MEITIVKGSMDYIVDCEDSLLNSELGIRYFSEKGSARKALEDGFKKDEIYVALDINHNCKGFIWFILKAAFHSFPYLHIIAVKKENRKLGIGKKLLEFFENICFIDYTKLFLVVGDFNHHAKVLYEKIGYIEVGILPGLYREGINEYLMMKIRDEEKSYLK
ncbi:N-acetyltransferase [Clostridium sp. CF012]|uniref:GNAT family N-acetyltransferase n=1 Tax=Clostridium sp. CF012 TaxID=2843319 RepID=UPI001C0B16EA|nr:GNAT family N-acetyltransferase [Clostridium sp. CF012]MBU3143793.1 GNAT family N-acetyltransferase [Clostridium sp. CF012]